APGTTSGGRRARPFVGRRRVPSAEHQLLVEDERGKRRDEDGGDQRPPGRPVHRSGQHPGEDFVEHKPRRLHREELDLQAMVFLSAMAAEAPAAVRTKPMLTATRKATSTAT